MLMDVGHNRGILRVALGDWAQQLVHNKTTADWLSMDTSKWLHVTNLNHLFVIELFHVLLVEYRVVTISSRQPQRSGHCRDGRSLIRCLLSQSKIAATTMKIVKMFTSLGLFWGDCNKSSIDYVVKDETSQWQGDDHCLFFFPLATYVRMYVCTYLHSISCKMGFHSRFINGRPSYVLIKDCIFLSEAAPVLFSYVFVFSLCVDCMGQTPGHRVPVCYCRRVCLCRNMHHISTVCFLAIGM